MNKQYFSPEIRHLFADENAFNRVMRLQGETYRQVPGRHTIKVELSGGSYFVKQHFGVGWKEIFKNLLTLRLPILTALTEWRAIQRLNQLRIPTTPAVGYGVRGHNPATVQSFLITEDLGDIVSLETFCADWLNHPPPPRLKRRLIVAVAKLAATLHDNGLNHRDFYICHLCLDRKKMLEDEIYLYLIDLHRVGIRHKISPVARMKDMAALYFSAMDIGLSRKDYLRFLRCYRAQSLSKTLSTEHTFWHLVSRRASKLYSKIHGKSPDTIF